MARSFAPASLPRAQPFGCLGQAGSQTSAGRRASPPLARRHRVGRLSAAPVQSRMAAVGSLLDLRGRHAVHHRRRSVSVNNDGVASAAAAWCSSPTASRRRPGADADSRAGSRRGHGALRPVPPGRVPGSVPAPRPRLLRSARVSCHRSFAADRPALERVRRVRRSRCSTSGPPSATPRRRRWPPTTVARGVRQLRARLAAGGRAATAPATAGSSSARARPFARTPSTRWVTATGADWMREAARSDRTKTFSNCCRFCPSSTPMAFLPISGAGLPGGESSSADLAADAADGTLMVHNYGALRCLDSLLPQLDCDGFVLVRDYGNTTSGAPVHRIARRNASAAPPPCQSTSCASNVTCAPGPSRSLARIAKT